MYRKASVTFSTIKLQENYKKKVNKTNGKLLEMSVNVLEKRQFCPTSYEVFGWCRVSFYIDNLVTAIRFYVVRTKKNVKRNEKSKLTLLGCTNTRSESYKFSLYKKQFHGVRLAM